MADPSIASGVLDGMDEVRLVFVSVFHKYYQYLEQTHLKVIKDTDNVLYNSL